MWCEMDADDSNPYVHRHKLVTDKESGSAAFQLCIDRNESLSLYPSVDWDTPGVGALCGPDRKGMKRSWFFQGSPGEEYELVLNLAERDPSKTLTICAPVGSM